MRITVSDTHDAKYLVTEDGNQPGSFEEKMLLSLSDPVIIRPVSGNPSGSTEVKYDITGLETLAEVYNKKHFSADDISGIIFRLHDAVRCMEDHMLKDDNLLIDPRYIYLYEGRVRFIAVRNPSERFSEGLEKLSRFMFLYADTEDGEAVRMSSGILRTVFAGNPRMHDIIRLCGRDRKETEEVLSVPEPETAREPSLPAFEGGVKEVFPYRDNDTFIKKESRNAQLLKSLKIPAAAAAVTVIIADVLFFIKGKAFIIKLLPVIAAVLLAELIPAAVILLKKKQEMND